MKTRVGVAFEWGKCVCRVCRAESKEKSVGVTVDRELDKLKCVKKDGHRTMLSWKLAQTKEQNTSRKSIDVEQRREMSQINGEYGVGDQKKKRGRPVCCRSLENPGGVLRNVQRKMCGRVLEGVRSDLPTGPRNRAASGCWAARVVRRSCGGATSIGKEKLVGLGLLARRVQGSGGEASGGSIKSGRNAGTGRFRE
jgi:hypothetical protein